MINNYNDASQVEYPRAFRTDPSWYEAYWYRKPALRDSTLLNQSIARLVATFQRAVISKGKFAEIIRTGAAWPRIGGTR